MGMPNVPSVEEMFVLESIREPSSAAAVSAEEAELLSSEATTAKSIPSRASSVEFTAGSPMPSDSGVESQHQPLLTFLRCTNPLQQTSTFISVEFRTCYYCPSITLR